MKNTKFTKITKTIIADLLSWSSKANGIPKQEIIDEIFKGLSRGSLKKKGEDVTEYTYLDKGTESRFAVNFATKTIQQDETHLYEFNIAEETKAVKAPKVAAAPKEPKTKTVKTTPTIKSMEEQRKDVKDFLDKNFSIGFTPEGKITKFQLLSTENKQMGVDMILGGIILCVINNVPGITNADEAVRLWLKGLQSSKKIEEDVTAKSPSPRKVSEPVVAKAKKAKK